MLKELTPPVVRAGYYIIGVSHQIAALKIFTLYKSLHYIVNTGNISHPFILITGDPWAIASHTIMLIYVSWFFGIPGPQVRAE